MIGSIRQFLTKNSSRIYLANFAQRAASTLSQKARVLDAGAGDCPYRAVFQKAEYESTDICLVEKNYGKISYISDLSQLPIQSNSYDLVFCSQTLEHVPEPQTVVKEFYRVLKPGGRLWATAPFFYGEHEAPYDFYRYSQFGLQYLFNQSGFKVESIEWLEGYFGTLAYQLGVAARALPLKPSDLGSGIFSWVILAMVGVLKILFGLLFPFFTWLDLRSKYVSRGQCKNYAIIAEKPA